MSLLDTNLEFDVKDVINNISDEDIPLYIKAWATTLHRCYNKYPINKLGEILELYKEYKSPKLFVNVLGHVNVFMDENSEGTDFYINYWINFCKTSEPEMMVTGDFASLIRDVFRNHYWNIMLVDENDTYKLYKNIIDKIIKHEI